MEIISKDWPPATKGGAKYPNEQIEQVTLTPEEMMTYRRAALEAAAAVANRGDPPAKVMHEAGCFLLFMLYGLPIQPGEVVLSGRLAGGPDAIPDTLPIGPFDSD